MLKKLQSIFLVTLFLIPTITGTTTEAFATITEGANEVVKFCEAEEIDGYISIKSDIDEFFKAIPDDRNMSSMATSRYVNGITKNALLKDVSVSYSNGTIVFSSEVIVDGDSVHLDSDGTYYNYQDRFILAEMSDTADFKFVQLKIDKDTYEANESFLRIILQNVSTQQVLVFRLPVDTSVFETLCSLPTRNPLAGDELIDKVLNLDSIDRNLIDQADDNQCQSGSTFHVEIPFEGDVSDLLFDEVSSAGAAGSFLGWDQLITALDNEGSVRLSQFSGLVDTLAFKTEGWFF